MDWLRHFWFMVIPVLGIIIIGVYSFIQAMRYGHANNWHAGRGKHDRTRDHGCC